LDEGDASARPQHAVHVAEQGGGLVEGEVFQEVAGE